MPALQRRWWAVRGEGAFCNGHAIHVSAVPDLAESQLTWSGIEDWDGIGRLDAIIGLGRACWRTRGIGDAWQYMLVAEGAAEIALDPEAKLWDLAALKVIVEEAGGRFTDLSGIASMVAAGSRPTASSTTPRSRTSDSRVSALASPDHAYQLDPGRSRARATNGRTARSALRGSHTSRMDGLFGNEGARLFGDEEARPVSGDVGELADMPLAARMRPSTLEDSSASVSCWRPGPRCGTRSSTGARTR